MMIYIWVSLFLGYCFVWTWLIMRNLLWTQCGYLRTSEHIFLYLPRDAMRKRGLCYRPVSVRPSVCLSVTLVYCIHTTEDIVKHFSWPGCPIILVFDHEHRYPVSRGTPSTGALNTWDWGKLAIFDWNRRLSRR